MTINQNDIKLDETSDEQISNVIKDGLRNFNSSYFKMPKKKPFTLYLKNENKIIAGIVGSFREDLMAIDLMWVEENYRRQGFGTKLLHKLAIYALSKNCKIIQLATFDFQAKPFYEKHGYKCIGTIAKLYKNIDLHYMRKTL